MHVSAFINSKEVPTPRVCDVGCSQSFNLLLNQLQTIAHKSMFVLLNIHSSQTYIMLTKTYFGYH